MEKSEKKREEILDAAMQCLARYGMVKSTLEDVARVVGMNKATLYYYYENKEAIFMDALERESGRFFDYATAKFNTAESASGKIELFIKALHEYFRNRAELLELNAQAMVDNHSLLQRLHKQLRSKNVDFIADLIQGGIDSGEFKELDARHVADILRSLLETRRMEIYKESTEHRDTRINFRKLETESLFIVELFMNGLKRNR